MNAVLLLYLLNSQITAQLAEAYGINSVRIETPDQLTNDLANALLEPGARLIEVLISPTEHVLPTIPPRKSQS